MDAREDKLPAWVKELLAGLRERLKIANEPLLQEVAKLRPQVQLLKARNEAMQELLACAAKGGHKTAQEITEIIEAYDLVLAKKDDDVEVWIVLARRPWAVNFVAAYADEYMAQQHQNLANKHRKDPRNIYDPKGERGQAKVEYAITPPIPAHLTDNPDLLFVVARAAIHELSPIPIVAYQYWGHAVYFAMRAKKRLIAARDNWTKNNKKKLRKFDPSIHKYLVQGGYYSGYQVVATPLALHPDQFTER